MMEYLGYAFLKVVLETLSMLLLKCGIITSCGLWKVNNMYLKDAQWQNVCFIQEHIFCAPGIVPEMSYLSLLAFLFFRL